MVLAHLITECEDLLICDLAETYGVMDYKSYSPNLIATLVVGLPGSSRIVRKYSNFNLTVDQALMAMLVDRVNALIYGLSQKRGKKPESVLQKLLKQGEKKDELMAFETPEEYEAWRKRKQEKWNG